jgi:hypothetical protein
MIFVENFKGNFLFKKKSTSVLHIKFTQFCAFQKHSSGQRHMVKHDRHHVLIKMLSSLGSINVFNVINHKHKMLFYFFMARKNFSPDFANGIFVAFCWKNILLEIEKLEKVQFFKNLYASYKTNA